MRHFGEKRTVGVVLGAALVVFLIFTAVDAMAQAPGPESAAEKKETKPLKHAKQIAEVNEKLAKDPKNIDLLMELGKFYGWDSDLAGAISAYERVVEIDPDHLEARKKLVDFYSWNNMTDKSTRQAEEVLRLEPDNIEIMEKLGYRYLYSGRYAESEAMFQRVLQKEPNRPKALKGLAEVKAARAKHKEAAQEYLNVLPYATTQQEKLEVYEKAARSYYYAKDYRKSREYAEEALRIDPSDEVALERLRKIEQELRPRAFAEYRHQSFKSDFERDLLDIGFVQPTEEFTITGIYRHYVRTAINEDRYRYESVVLELTKYMGDELTLIAGTEVKFYEVDATRFDYYLRALKEFRPGFRGDFLYEKSTEDADLPRLQQHVDRHTLSGTFYYDINERWSLITNLEFRYYTQGDAFSDNFWLSGFVSPVYHVWKEPILDLSYTYYRVYTFVKEGGPGEQFEYYAPHTLAIHNVTVYFQRDFDKKLRLVAADTVGWVDESGLSYVQNTILGELIFTPWEGDSLSLRYIRSEQIFHKTPEFYKNDEWRVKYSHKF